MLAVASKQTPLLYFEENLSLPFRNLSAKSSGARAFETPRARDVTRRSIRHYPKTGAEPYLSVSMVYTLGIEIILYTYTHTRRFPLRTPREEFIARKREWKEVLLHRNKIAARGDTSRRASVNLCRGGLSVTFGPEMEL